MRAGEGERMKKEQEIERNYAPKQEQPQPNGEQERSSNNDSYPQHTGDTHGTETIQPSILYYGTPVLMLSTLNENGSTNLSPLSSSWALGIVSCLVLEFKGRHMRT